MGEGGGWEVVACISVERISVWVGISMASIELNTAIMKSPHSVKRPDQNNDRGNDIYSVLRLSNHSMIGNLAK